MAKNWLVGGGALLAVVVVAACGSKSTSSTASSSTGDKASSGTGGKASTGSAPTGTSTSTATSGGAGGGPAAAIGLPCTSDSSCGPAPLTCITASSNNAVFGGGPANGYCSVACMQDSDCPDSTSACFKGDATSGAGVCVVLCGIGPALTAINEPIATDGKCQMRDDVACAPLDASGTVDGCLPVCGSDSQCPSGMHCDPDASVCVATPATGSPLGAACDPNATTNTCAGSCVSLGAADAGAPSLCSSECVLGGVVPFTSSPNCNGPTNGLCILSPDGSGAGDLGFCTPACTSQSDCQTPALWCFGVAGLTGATGGVANGFCFSATSCLNGASDCASISGTACTQTASGPFCLSTTFPLGSSGPDGGTGDAGTGDAGTDGGGGAGGGDGG